MRLVVTGGGTGGHVYPALEVARLASTQGWIVSYLGSIRGQEGRACADRGIPFVGFPSEPLYSLKTPRGWRGAAKLLRACAGARRELRSQRPDVVFSTGGYSGAPVMSAARRLRVPYVVHEQNCVPGRSNLMFAKSAFAVATTFRGAERHFAGCRVVRTGLPVRDDLRACAAERKAPSEWHVLVVGGSQGAAAINEAAIGTAQRMTSPKMLWLHQTGKAHFESIFKSMENLAVSSCYQVKPFFEGPEMGKAYTWASVVVGRSGAGTMAELAAFGLPSILIPLPAAGRMDPLANAREFEEMGAAKLLEQSNLHPASLEEALRAWLDDDAAIAPAGEALREWDVPDSAQRIMSLLSEAAAPTPPG
jgi:UDP-N-acetylglucosamine--N-acetylmuramyl-(pentapeptide) pyrophosphoryl-undecaprenol N-acetylglucosamine transferase